MDSLAGPLWRVTSILHSSHQMALPILLLFIASVLLVYRHLTDKGFHRERDPLKTFLTLIVVQMLPLIFLEVKLLRVPDPLHMLSKFGPKVLLMHVCFLLLRVVSQPWRRWESWFVSVCSLIGLVAAFIVLDKGFNFKWSLKNFVRQTDVWTLALLALGFGVVTELIDIYTRKISTRVVDTVIMTSSDYIEIIAFVPAVWMIYRTDMKDPSDDYPTSDPRTRVVYFFAFLVGFYFAEDVLGAVNIYTQLPMAAAGYMLHYVLLCDVALFLLAHIYNPEQMKGALRTTLLRWLPENSQV